MNRSPQSLICPGAPMLFYRAVLPLSRATLAYVAGVIRRHRRQIGSCRRKYSPGQQALLVLAHLRKGETFAELAAGSGSAPRRPGGTSSRPCGCWPAGPRSCAVRCGPRRSTPTWCWMGLSFPWTAWRRTGRSIPASTAAMG